MRCATRSYLDLSLPARYAAATGATGPATNLHCEIIRRSTEALGLVSDWHQQAEGVDLVFSVTDSHENRARDAASIIQLLPTTGGDDAQPLQLGVCVDVLREVDNFWPVAGISWLVSMCSLISLAETRQ